MNRSVIAAVVAAATVLAVSAPAAAQAPRNALASETIRFDTASLIDPAAVDALHRRIVRTAVRVCDSGRVYGVRGGDRCMRMAVDRAVAQAELAPLSVLHAALDTGTRYHLRRSRIDAETERLVAEAAGGFGAAGTIAQPGDPVPLP